MPVCLRWLVSLLLLGTLFAQTPRDTKGVNLWVLKPVVRPQAPAGVTKSTNPIDAFIAADYKKKALADLAQSIKQGFPEFDWMAKDPDFKAINNDPEFKKLLESQPATKPDDKKVESEE